MGLKGVPKKPNWKRTNEQIGGSKGSSFWTIVLHSIAALYNPRLPQLTDSFGFDVRYATFQLLLSSLWM